MPRPNWSVVVCLLVCIYGALLFLALLRVGEHVMCKYTSADKPRYCTSDGQVR